MKKLKTILIGLVIGIVVALGYQYFNDKKKEEESHTLEDVIETESTADTVTIEQDNVPYSVTVNFNETILEEAEQEKKLIVMTQKASKSYEVTKDGLLSLDIFKQSKAMIFHGTGTYTVDLSDFTSDNIEVNDEDKTITVHIHKPELSIEILPEETEFFETDNGLLAFGEMKITDEMYSEIMSSGKEILYKELSEDENVTELATKFAEVSVEEFFQPVVDSAVDAVMENTSDPLAIGTYYRVNAVCDLD